MAKRKKNKNNGGGPNNPNKRAKQGGEHNVEGIGGFEGQRGYVDPSTGQRGAFPGLEKHMEDFYGPANDGIDYLRMVRSEAKTVPSLLLSANINYPPPPKAKKGRTPPRPPPPPARAIIPNNDVLDYDDPPQTEAIEEAIPELKPVIEVKEGSEEMVEVEVEVEVDVEEEEPVQEEEYSSGYFEDSTYISLIPSPAHPEPPGWHKILITRFRDIRSALHSEPPTPSDHSLPFKFGPKWMYSNPPTPGLLWKLDQPKTLALIRVAQRTIGTGTRTVRRGVDKDLSRWIWSLLIRVYDTLTADEMCIIRELGKTAIKSLKAIQAAEEEEEEEVEEEEDEIEVPLEENNVEESSFIDSKDYDSEPEEGEVKDTAATAPVDKVTEEGEVTDALGKDVEAENIFAPIPSTPDKEAEFGDVPAPTPIVVHDEPKEGKPEDAPAPPTVDNEPEEGELEETPISPKGKGPAEAEAERNPSTAEQEVSQSGQQGIKIPAAEPVDKKSTVGALDMIVSIVGDYFGQRDLLDERIAMLAATTVDGVEAERGEGSL